MANPGAPRLPLAPLLRQIDLAYGPRRTDHDPTARGYFDATPDRLAILTGRGRRVALRWLAAGELPDYAADHAATRLGLHPALLWPEWWHLAAPCTERQYANTLAKIHA